jgi:hypothetical protein
VDIAGAKALKHRLGNHGREEAPPVSVDIPEDAPPVYHYLGVETAPETPKAAPDKAPAGRGLSRLRRLLSLG